MRTIGRTRPADSPPGDFPCLCDICGVPWWRSQLRRDFDGLLVCPGEGSGRAKGLLDEMNVALAGTQRGIESRFEGGTPMPKNTETGATLASVIGGTSPGI